MPARLRRQGGDQLVLDLARSFLTRTPERLQALRGARTPGAVVDVAHSFKTSCRIVGALGMGDLCEALEYAAEQDVLPAAERLDALERAFYPVRAWLQELLEQGASPP